MSSSGEDAYPVERLLLCDNCDRDDITDVWMDPKSQTAAWTCPECRAEHDAWDELNEPDPGRDEDLI